MSQRALTACASSLPVRAGYHEGWQCMWRRMGGWLARNAREEGQASLLLALLSLLSMTIPFGCSRVDEAEHDHEGRRRIAISGSMMDSASSSARASDINGAITIAHSARQGLPMLFPRMPVLGKGEVHGVGRGHHGFPTSKWSPPLMCADETHRGGD